MMFYVVNYMDGSVKKTTDPESVEKYLDHPMYIVIDPETDCVVAKNYDTEEIGDL
jgi:hypothetical protein